MGSESMFLVCGMCSQVADEAMTIDDVSLRSFLVHMLTIGNEDLPAKVCTDCYQGTASCKKFADRCGRAIARLKNTHIADDMILGKSPNKGPGQTERMFLVCGLCSQVANESMTIDDTGGLRSFLIHTLSITNDDLPAKICTDCFPEMAESKKFADRCSRAIARLKNTQIADHMILGKTPKKEVKQAVTQEVEAEASLPTPATVQKDTTPAVETPAKKPAKPPATPKPQATPKPSPASKKETKSRKAELPTDLIIDSPSGRRATRGAAVTTTEESPAATGRKTQRGADSARGAVNKDETPAKSRTGRTAKTPEASSSPATAKRGPKRPPPSSAPDDPPTTPGTWRSLSLAKSSGQENSGWERHAVTNSQFRFLTARKNQPKVAITSMSKSLSDRALHSGKMSVTYKDIGMGFRISSGGPAPRKGAPFKKSPQKAVAPSPPSGPSGPRKRGRPPSSSSSGGQRGDGRPPSRAASDGVIVVSDEDEDGPLTVATPPAKKSRTASKGTTDEPTSSFGRVKKANSKDTLDDVPLNKRKRGRPSSSSSSPPVSKAKAKPGPKSAKARAAAARTTAGPASRSRRATPEDDNGDESEDDPFQANDEEDPLDVSPLKQKRTTPVSKAKSKPGPKSAKAKTAASRVAPPPTSSAKKKKKQSTVNGASDHEEGGSHLASSFLEDVGPDEEEAFSSVGPYQCEICQAISEMKEDFVYHIRNYHGDIVDGEVLKSLDRDLMIRKKKKKLMANGPGTPNGR